MYEHSFKLILMNFGHSRWLRSKKFNNVHDVQNVGSQKCQHVLSICLSFTSRNLTKYKINRGNMCQRWFMVETSRYDYRRINKGPLKMHLVLETTMPDSVQSTTKGTGCVWIDGASMPLSYHTLLIGGISQLQKSRTERTKCRTRGVVPINSQTTHRLRSRL